MGDLCSGLAPSPPQIDPPSPEAVTEAVQGALGDVSKQFNDNKIAFPGELASLEDGEEFEVPDTTMKLAKDASADEINKAALTSAFATTARDKVKDAVWDQLSPDLEAQVPDDTPARLKNMALDKIKEKSVDPAVDAACDELMEKLSGGDDEKDADAGNDVQEEDVADAPAQDAAADAQNDAAADADAPADSNADAGQDDQNA